MILAARLARGLAGLVLGLVGTAAAFGAASPAAAVPPAASSVTRVVAGQARVELLSQTTWVRLGGVFTLDLGIVTPHPSSDLVQVAAYPAVSTRSGFEVAASGTEASSAGWYDVQPVESLPRAAGGKGVAVHIPVDSNASAPAGEKAFVPGSGEVYPLEVQLFDAKGVPLGKPFTTFLVVAPRSGQVAERLAVATVVPLGSPTPRLDHRLGLVPTGGSGVAATEAALEGAPGTPVSLEVDPEALAALRAGSAEQRRAVAEVRSLAAGGDQLLPAPYVPVRYVGLQASGLAGQVVPQISAGTSALRGSVGRAPSGHTWVVDQALDGATLDTLERSGLRRLVVPASDVSGLPSADTVLTYGRPTPLAGGSDPAVVWSADGPLSARLGDRRAPVLAAEQDLAELVVTQLEAPNLSRGVVLLAPDGVSPGLLATLTAGLAANPYLQPVTVDRLFQRVPMARGAPPRYLVVPKAVGVLGDQPGIVELSSQLGSFHRLVPSDTALYATVRRVLLVAESDRLADGGYGRSLLAWAAGRIRSWEGRVSLPPAASITLTSRSGSLPVTIRSVPHTRVNVTLELTASKLAFRVPRWAAGHCRTTYQSETCDLSVDGALTTFRIPVVSRTSGVFALAVDLDTPDGSVVLGSDRDTVRSTAVSWVGLVLMVVAGLSLLLWWVNNIRHGRRARRLVPRPGGSDVTEPQGVESDPLMTKPSKGNHAHHPSRYRQRL